MAKRIVDAPTTVMFEPVPWLGAQVLGTDFLEHPQAVYSRHNHTVYVSRPPGPDRSDRWAVFVWLQRLEGRQAVRELADAAYARLGLSRPLRPGEAS